MYHNTRKLSTLVQPHSHILFDGYVIVHDNAVYSVPVAARVGHRDLRGVERDELEVAVNTFWSHVKDRQRSMNGKLKGD